MFKASDPELIDKLCKIFDDHCVKLRDVRSRFGPSQLWLNKSRYVDDYLLFILTYDAVPNIDRKLAIEELLDGLSVDENTYIGVHTFGNGIEFRVFVDMLDYFNDENDIEINSGE